MRLLNISLILCQLLTQNCYSRGNEKFCSSMAGSDLSIFLVVIPRYNARFASNRSDHRSCLPVVGNGTPLGCKLSCYCICLPTAGVACQQTVRFLFPFC